MTSSERPVTSTDLLFHIIRRWACKKERVVSIVIQRVTDAPTGRTLAYECSAHTAGCECIAHIAATYPERPEPSTKPAA